VIAVSAVVSEHMVSINDFVKDIPF